MSAYRPTTRLADLPPLPADAPTVVSTFAGTGGSSLGYRLAGFKVRLAVEWENLAAESYRLNFPDTPLHHGDICALSDADALRLSGLAPGELDVFDGSPPCQGFSTAGKRDEADPRNQLFREYTRLLRAFRPRVFVMENVSGMVKGKMARTFVEILRDLKSCGYRVSARLLNAMYFGVPQARQRMIFVGVREDLNVDPSHPKAQTRPYTVREAIGSDGFFFFGSGMKEGERIPFDAPSPTVMKEGIAGSARHQCGAFVAAQDGPLAYLPAPPLTGKTLQVALLLRPGDNGLPDGTWWSSTRLHPDRPAPTICKQGALYQRYPNWVHPSQTRGLSIGELRRLGAFPDDFQFVGKWVDAWARIGNSVPPPLMAAVARHIREKILCR